MLAEPPQPAPLVINLAMFSSGQLPCEPICEIGWQSEFGGCETYAENMQNHDWCEADLGLNWPTLAAGECCESCGLCLFSSANYVPSPTPNPTQPPVHSPSPSSSGGSTGGSSNGGSTNGGGGGPAQGFDPVSYVAPNPMLHDKNMCKRDCDLRFTPYGEKYQDGATTASHYTMGTRVCDCSFIGANVNLNSPPQFLCESADGTTCFSMVEGWCASDEHICEVPFDG